MNIFHNKINNAAIPVMLHTNNYVVTNHYIAQVFLEAYGNSVGKFSLLGMASQEKPLFALMDPIFFQQRILSALDPVLCVSVVAIDDSDSTDKIYQYIQKQVHIQTLLPCQTICFLLSTQNNEVLIKPNRQTKKIFQMLQQQIKAKVQYRMIEIDSQKQIPEQFFIDVISQIKQVTINKIYQCDLEVKQTKADSFNSILLSKLNYCIMLSYIFQLKDIVNQVKLTMQLQFKQINKDQIIFNSINHFYQISIPQPLFLIFTQQLGIFQQAEKTGKFYFLPKQQVNQQIVNNKKVQQPDYISYKVTKDDFTLFNSKDENLNNIQMDSMISLSIIQQQYQQNIQFFQPNQLNSDEKHQNKLLLEIIISKLINNELSQLEAFAYLLNLLIVSSTQTELELVQILNQFTKYFVRLQDASMLKYRSELQLQQNKQQTDQQQKQYLDQFKMFQTNQLLVLQQHYIDLILYFNLHPNIQYKFNQMKLLNTLEIRKQFNQFGEMYNHCAAMKNSVSQIIIKQFETNNQLQGEHLMLTNQVFIVFHQQCQQFIHMNSKYVLLTYNKLQECLISQQTFNDNVRTVFLKLLQQIQEKNDLLLYSQLLQYAQQNIELLINVLNQFLQSGIIIIQNIAKINNSFDPDTQFQQCITTNISNCSVEIKAITTISAQMFKILEKIRADYLQFENTIEQEVKIQIYSINFALTNNTNINWQLIFGKQQITMFNPKNHFQLSEPILLKAEIFNIDNYYVQFTGHGRKQQINLFINLQQHQQFKNIKIVMMHISNEFDKTFIMKLKNGDNRLIYEYPELKENENLQNQYYYLNEISISTNKESWYIFYKRNIQTEEADNIIKLINQKAQDEIHERLLTNEKLLHKINNSCIINMIPYKHECHLKQLNEQIFVNCEQNIIIQVRVPHLIQYNIQIHCQNITILQDIEFFEQTQEDEFNTRESIFEQTMSMQSQQQTKIRAQKMIYMKKDNYYQINYQAYKVFYVKIPAFVDEFKNTYSIQFIFEHQKLQITKNINIKPVILYFCQFMIYDNKLQVSITNQSLMKLFANNFHFIFKNDENSLQFNIVDEDQQISQIFDLTEQFELKGVLISNIDQFSALTDNYQKSNNSSLSISTKQLPITATTNNNEASKLRKATSFLSEVSALQLDKSVKRSSVVEDAQPHSPKLVSRPAQFRNSFANVNTSFSLNTFFQQYKFIRSISDYNQFNNNINNDQIQLNQYMQQATKILVQRFSIKFNNYPMVKCLNLLKPKYKLNEMILLDYELYILNNNHQIQCVINSHLLSNSQQNKLKTVQEQQMSDKLKLEESSSQISQVDENVLSNKSEQDDKVVIYLELQNLLNNFIINGTTSIILDKYNPHQNVTVQATPIRQGMVKLPQFTQINSDMEYKGLERQQDVQILVKK